MSRVLQLQDASAEELLKPESPLEKKLLTIPEFDKGLHWGTPRFGHPEGKVLFHILDVLENIDRLAISSPLVRQRLRLIALTHDTFKYLESKKRQPRDWSKHHAVLARRFMEKYSDDEVLLNIIQWHDEAYYSWRVAEIQRYPSDGEKRLANLFEKIGDNNQLLYYQFFMCDTCTGDKNKAPVRWLEERLIGIEPIKF